MGTLIVDTIGGRNDNAPNQSDGLTVTGVCSATDFSGLVGGAADFPNGVTVTDSTASTSTTSGALIVSGGVGIAKSLFVGEGISIAGTITYNDVTNVDSIGIVTAGKGLRATTGGLVVSAGNVKVTAGIVTVGAGVTISSDFIHIADNSKINVGTGSDLQIWHDGSHSQIKDAGSGGMHLWSGDFRFYNAAGSEYIIKAAENGSVDLYYDNSKKIETISTGASVYGGLRLEGGGLMREHFNTSGTALNSGKDINCSSGMVHYRSAAVGAANVKLNVVSTAGINTDMAIGDAMTLTVITVAGNTAHFVDQIRVDGVEASAGVTTHWVGGSAPTEGGGSGVDTYAFNILKTGNAAYLVVGNHVKTS